MACVESLSFESPCDISGGLSGSRTRDLSQIFILITLTYVKSESVYNRRNMDLSKLIEVGEKFGLSGNELKSFVTAEQKRARDERAEQLELKRREKEVAEIQLEIEREKRNARESNGSEMNLSQVVANKAKAPKLPTFYEERDDIDSYLQRFERYAKSQNWPETDWAIYLSTLLTGSALEVFTQLSYDDGNNFKILKNALLKRFHLTEDGFRSKFATGKPHTGETGHQYATRMENYLDRWIELAGIKLTFQDLKDLILRCQYIEGCHRDLVIFLKERQPTTMQQTVTLVDHYLDARGGYFKTQVPPRQPMQPGTSKRNEGKPLSSQAKSFQENNKQKTFFNCRQIGHLARNCPASAPKQPLCYLCRKTGHYAKDCRFTSTKAAGLMTAEETTIPGANHQEWTPHDSEVSTQGSYTCKCIDGMMIQMPNSETSEEIRTDHVKLDCGHTFPILSAACTSKSFIMSKMPVSQGFVGTNKASVLRDSGCSGVVVKQNLVKPSEMTGRLITCILIDRTVKRFPLAIVDVDTPYFTGRVEAVCMQNPLYDLILGNITGVRAADDPDLSWSPKFHGICAVETRAQRRDREKPYRALKTPKPFENIVTPQMLKTAQQEDPTLNRARELANSQDEKVTRHNGTSSFYFHNDLLHRKFHSPKVEEGHVFTQIVVPKPYRRQVMQIAHEALLGGHQGAKKTLQKVLTNFFWPGITTDITRFCRSCDVCQRTISKGRVPKVPLGKMPLIEVPFDRIAVDIVGPIHPVTEQKNRYILTVIDYATRYPEAIPLQNIEAERVAEALVSIFTRVGIPKEMLTDQGSQFTSEVMKQVSKLLSVKQFTTSPYHPAANGLVERFNGTLKQMIKRMCAENPNNWDRYIEPLLFAVREAPQESMGYSPFELLYGRKVRGPIAILRELWTGEADTAETKTTYQYVLDLKNRLDETCRNAHEELQKSSTRYERYYNRNAKHREFQVGDQVLLLLPTDRNKLLLQWKGPFLVVDKVSDTDYRIDLSGKSKIFHINLLKKYYPREEVSALSNEDTVNSCAAVIEDENLSSDTTSENQEYMSNTSLLQPYPIGATESAEDVNINENLLPSQTNQVKALLTEFQDILTDIPGCTSLGQHTIELKQRELPKGKPYPIPHALRDTVKKEVKTMLSLNVIEPSNSPYASPIVIVKKPDGTNRFCVDFRKLNKVTKFDAEPVPDQEELFTRIAKGKYFTKVDLSKGYWQIPMESESKSLTAFITPDGLFQFRVMPFGLVNAPASFSRIMRKLLDGLEGALNYIDDILVYSTSWQQHLETLTELLTRIRAAKLTARPSKCYFGHESVEFLGHVIGHGQVAPRPEKVTAIQEVKQPKTKKQLRSFLGMMNYYRKFIPNYAAIAVPLTDKTKKLEPNIIKWETSQENAFHALKSKLANPPILHLPDLNGT
nr:uncharacterized protein LOC129256850 isoform X2 [Lytechinus pictus]